MLKKRGKKKTSAEAEFLIANDPLIKVSEKGTEKVEQPPVSSKEHDSQQLGQATENGEPDYRKDWANASFPEKIAMRRYTYVQSENVFDFERVRKEEEEVIPAPRDRRIGVSFSGGGIRSACFHAGVLQAFKNKNFLYSIDYLSIVSGGAYVGAAYM
jgi:hypothetical protein